jgi:hypothetical protein
MDSLNSLHLVLDAGHIAVESALADQKEVQSVQAKRGQALQGDDYGRLQSLMYDKFSLKLESTQVRVRTHSRFPCSPHNKASSFFSCLSETVGIPA